MNGIRNTLLVLGALAGLAASTGAEAHGWGGPRVVFGFNFGVPLYYPAYPPAYYAPAPVVVQQPVVIQQPPSQYVYQYYCPASNAYYPAVPTCPQPWLRVVPDGTVQ
jgi:hypothetical protein